MEKIRSGQSFLYREGGLNSTVIEIRMKKKVKGDSLREALDLALVRYPYFSVKLVEKFGDFFLEENKQKPVVKRTDKSYVLGSMSVGYHLIHVTYMNERIKVAFHHALCDGKGIKPFIETLIYYYVSKRYNKSFKPNGIRLAGEPFLVGETREPFDKAYAYEAFDTPQYVKEGYHLKEYDKPHDKFYRYEILINKVEFVSYAKHYEATPGILAALLISKAIYQSRDSMDKPIVCSMASDMRKELGVDYTYKNCVRSIYLDYNHEDHQQDLKNLVQKYRKQLTEQREINYVKSLANSHMGLNIKLDQFDTYDDKKGVLSFFDDMLIDTFVLSYLGQFNLGDWHLYVDSIHLYNSGVKGLRVNMIDAGEFMTIDILQDFEQDDILDELKRQFEMIGFDFSISGKIEFETVKDLSYKTARHQAERYYKLPRKKPKN